MPKLCGSLAGLLAAGLLLTSPAFAITLYALSESSRGLYAVDTANLGTPQFLGAIASGTGSDLAELAVASSGRLYTVDRITSHLLTLDRATGAIVADVAVDVSLSNNIQPRGLDVSPDGILYAVTAPLATWTPQSLRTVDPLTGTTAVVATISGATGVEAIAFAPDGTLYAVGSPTQFNPSDTLYRLNRVTGSLSSIATMSLPGGATLDVDDLAFGPDGFLYGADSNFGTAADLYRIDPATGALVNLGSTGVLELNGLAAVPVPAAVWLLGSALGVLGWMKRKIAS